MPSKEYKNCCIERTTNRQRSALIKEWRLRNVEEGQFLRVPDNWDFACDILIIGAGVAGLMASIEAHDKGAKVLLVEMAESPFFAESAICAGGMAIPGSRIQSEQGIQDSPTLLFEDMMRVGKYSNRRELVRLFVSNVVEAYDRFLELGAQCKGLYHMGGHSVLRSHDHDALQVQETLYKQIKKRGIPSLFKTRAKSLIVDPKTWRVFGVEAEKENKEKIYLRGKVTVLATGGMCGNPEMIEKYVPRVNALACCAELGENGNVRPIGLGDGLTMAMAIGADTTHLYSITIYTGIPHRDYPDYSNYLGRPWFPSYTEGAIAVNKEGKRFIDEACKAPCEVGEEMLLQTDQMLFKICDSVAFNKMAENAGEQIQIVEDPKSYLWVANTIEELAAKANIDERNLKNTIETYNRNVDLGLDTEFGRSKEFLTRIDTPLFVAYQNWLAPLHNSGGLRANERLQILNVYGEAIPGLFGAGEVIGGTSGEVYLSNTHYAAAMTFGYLAGKEFAIEEALTK
jgi:fumarate reductase flavoprotein subunit